MAILNTDYEKQESLYTDGAVEIELLRVLDEEDAGYTDSWPLFYHLSPIRENILSWYDFKPGAKILEIGSGCGALTGLLCEKAKEVTSIELTRPRAEVNYKRNAHRDNLEIIVGDFNEIELKDDYDYVVLNGVLEYAASFTDRPDPYLSFLKQVGRVLKEDGVLLIAIENRLGLKYLNGAPEDHLDMLFRGVNGYVKDDPVRTFSKRELGALLGEAGFTYQDFYYPYPDYKLPEVVLSEEAIKNIDPGAEAVSYNAGRVSLFDESVVQSELVKSGIAGYFSNSFLVAASRRPLKDRKLYMAKYANGRKKDFATATIIYGDKKDVLKRALFDEGKKHLERMLTPPSTGALKNVGSRRVGEDVHFDFVSGPSLEEVLLEDLKNEDLNAFDRRICAFKDELYKNTRLGEDYAGEEFKEVFGEESGGSYHLKPGNLDLIFSNVIEAEEPTVIDYEWTFDFELPQEFVLFRSLYYLYHQNEAVRDLFELEELLSRYGIKSEDVARFIAWDEHFGNVYVKKEDDYKPYQILEAAPLLQEQLMASREESSLYLDFGQGLKEETRIKVSPDFDGEDFEVYFDLTPILEREDRPLRELRWDPVEGYCLLEDLKVCSNLGEMLIKPGGIYSAQVIDADGKLLFLDNDPYFILLGQFTGIEWIKITGKRIPLTFENEIPVLSEQEETLTNLREENVRAEDELLALKRKVRLLEQRLSDEKYEALKWHSAYDRLKNTSPEALFEIIEQLRGK